MLRQLRFEYRTHETNKHSLRPQWFDFISWNYNSVETKKTKRAADTHYLTSSARKIHRFQSIDRREDIEWLPFTTCIDSLTEYKLWIVCTVLALMTCLSCQLFKNLKSQKTYLYPWKKDINSDFVKVKERSLVLLSLGWPWLTAATATSAIWRQWFL